jgi:putative endonuclease
LKRWDREHAHGRRAEDLAHRFLEGRGFRVVSRNYRRQGGKGELDLVAWDGGTLVFIEVKARSSESFGTPESAVDAEKRRQLVLAAAEFARRARVALDQTRFDIVSVVLGRPPSIRHIRAAFGRRQ